ncbi:MULTISPECIES: phosphatase PAP2 family protein [Acinetobacter]|jgi:undecaprenyl-diphosphatase|uniref:undecaprenyl-diphosphate phosphatase n=1 Tax=Acinetobacter johnsonii TaxID=40214 RepID=A0A239RV52_ACIJO|nr:MULTISPECIES: phosphatase PAP2 family protein [Acinetobacter]NWK62474.1 phosphatase PAP2 family protein [Acinetobacter sp. SwsAc3]ALV73283.1 undecaprenyl-pyrophosphatase YbjG [Acinetobacter johnsonii XBB1]MBK5647589.1 phosphatase PAP2 family protein [Acinetobacter sp.]MBO7705397.1 phosphatase PAP2 family protein [Acinetobacter sp.]MCV2451039.1 phosphatase PAP2 family protein [Acinetobacter johnsonii]
MTLSELNLSLFSWINASPEATNTSIHFAIFIANDLLYCMILLFAWFWLRGNYDTKKQILKAFIFTSIAILISQCISHVYYHPRPFVMEVGRTLIYHAPNGSFPSDHMLIFSSIAFSYLFSAQRKLGIFLLVMAWLVAWSRVYLGVHFPLDMLGAFLLAFALNFFGLKLWNLYKEKIMQWALTLHFYLFKPLIQKGYIK